MVRVAAAQFIFEGAAAVLKHVHDVIGGKEFEHAEYAGFVKRFERTLDVGEADGTRRIHQRLIHENAVGGGFHSFVYQHALKSGIVHNR